ncbi:nuclease A inhibitor family protein [Polyangium aurulentum]|uniref:nuclease A inhibitor family protein n=1 Tax=Polyangium aurulentum TaxID=2567896 RepID=UPI0010ADE3AA|nr:nuclease A inhibitor family protein [Polyangium aurulentum]UQA58364.1 nuclease A inhibitor family protein [Polyangium aurulentum]
MKADPTATLSSIEEAARGLLFPSESDRPLLPYRFGPEEPTPEAVLRARGLPAETPVEEVSLASFFEGVTQAPEGAAEEDATAERFRALVALLERELTELRVLRVGKVDIDALVLGRHPSGEWIGVSTQLVET